MKQSLGTIIHPTVILPVAEHEPVRDIKVVDVEHNQRNRVVPREPVQQSVRHSADHATLDEDNPEPTQETHVAVLVTLVCFSITRCSPEQLDTKETVLDGGQVSVRLDQHNVLDVHAVGCLGPEAENEQAVDNGGDGEGKVVVLEPLGAEPQEEDTRDGGDKDA